MKSRNMIQTLMANYIDLETYGKIFLFQRIKLTRCSKKYQKYKNDPDTDCKIILIHKVL